VLFRSGIAAFLALSLRAEPAGPPPPPPGSLRLMSQNVHYIDLTQAGGRWSGEGWMRRRAALDAAFRKVAPDLAAFQEMESFEGGSVPRQNLALDWLLSRNAGYAAAAVGDPRVFPSTQPILYRRDRLEVLGQGWFFFSDTPDVIYSRSFDGGFPAFASWAQFRDRRTGAVLRVVNAHFDFASRQNRLRSAALVADRIAPWIAAGERVALAGDLNALRGTRTLRVLEAAGIEFLPVPGPTYHFDRGIGLFGAIDHIGLGPGLSSAAPPGVLRLRFDRAWPSDHFPVWADLRVE